MGFLSIGLIVVGILILVITGLQVLLSTVDVLRGMPARENNRPDALLYAGIAVGLACLLIGLILFHVLAGLPQHGG